MIFQRITIDATQMHGAPCIRGLQIPVAMVVDMVASGMSTDEILDAHPGLEAEDIREALYFAAATVREGRFPKNGALPTTKRITLEQIKAEHARRLAAGAFENAKSLANRWVKPELDLSDDELEAGISEFANEWQQELDEFFDND